MQWQPATDEQIANARAQAQQAAALAQDQQKIAEGSTVWAVAVVNRDGSPHGNAFISGSARYTFSRLAQTGFFDTANYVELRPQ